MLFALFPNTLQIADWSICTEVEWDFHTCFLIANRNPSLNSASHPVKIPNGHLQCIVHIYLYLISHQS